MLWDRSTFWRKPERSNSETDPTRSCLCLVAFPRGISGCHSGCAKGDHKAQELVTAAWIKTLVSSRKVLCFLTLPTSGTWKFHERKCYEVKNGKFTIHWQGKEHPRRAKRKKGASSSTAFECCQLVLELECILSASTNILQQSLFVWMFFSSTEDTFVAPLCTWWGVLGQGPSMLHKGFGQLMFMNQHSFQKL